MMSCSLPSCFQADFEDAVLRVERWRGDDECVIFPVIADLHSNLTTTDPLFGQKRDSAAHILLMNEVAEKFNADFTADLGDVGVDVPLKTMDEIAILNQRILEYHGACRRRPVLFTLGNHDAGKLPEYYWGKAFLKLNSGVSMTHSTNGDYGFFDVSGKKTRVFWLNTSECEEHVSDTQLDFLKTNLDSLPEKHCAVILSHICSHERLGVSAPYRNRPFPEQFGKMNRILSDFVNRGGRLAGELSGHCHYDAEGKYYGINFFTLQGYGGHGPRENPADARVAQEFNPNLNRTDTFDMAKYSMIHLVVIKPQVREMKLFRIGAGGSVCDRGAYF